MYAIELSDDGTWTLIYAIVGLLLLVGAILFAKVK